MQLPPPSLAMPSTGFGDNGMNKSLHQYGEYLNQQYAEPVQRKIPDFLNQVSRMERFHFGQGGSLQPFPPQGFPGNPPIQGVYGSPSAEPAGPLQFGVPFGPVSPSGTSSPNAPFLPSITETAAIQPRPAAQNPHTMLGSTNIRHQVMYGGLGSFLNR